MREQLEAIAKCLHAEIIPFKDDLGEEMFQLPLKDTAMVQLEGYLRLEPASLAMRYRNAMGVEIRMVKVRVGVSQGWVLFESDEDHISRRLAINAKGSVRWAVGMAEDILKLPNKSNGFLAQRR